MGLLDDAIREHLDLKRRRGADPAEVERAEREALGPVRRAPEGAEQAGPGFEEHLAYDHQDQAEDWDEPFDEVGNGFAPEAPAEPEPFDQGEAHFADEPRLAAEPPMHPAAAEPVPPEEFERPPPAAAESFIDAGPPTTPRPHAVPAPPPEPRTRGPSRAPGRRDRRIRG